MKRIHFTGAGGVGMAGVAHIAADLGYEISGSDIAESEMLNSLRERGVPVSLGHGAIPPGTELLVYSSAVPEQDPERQAAGRLGIPQLRRGDFLNEIIAPQFSTRIAVAGSHGKSTTAAIIAHLLRKTGIRPGYLVGAAIHGMKRNASAGDGRILVSEVDESDGTQARFPATIAVVLNRDDDHSWALGGPAALRKCFDELCAGAGIVITPDSIRDMPALPRLDILPGEHNRSNARAAYAAVLAASRLAPRDIPAPQPEYLEDFHGIARRMAVHLRTPHIVLLEDYAHHPTELAATLQATAEAFPGRPMHILFQPHRLERVQRYGARFAELLSTAAWAGIAPPFGAWRTDNAAVDTETLLTNLITAPHASLSGTWTEMADAVLAHLPPPGGIPPVLMVIGAGDITKIVPVLRQKLEQAGM